MQKRFFVIALITVAMVLVGVMVRSLFYRELELQGKPISVWTAELNSPNVKVRESAASALRRLGTDAVPVLLEQLRNNDSWLKLRGSDLAGRLGVRVPPAVRRLLASRTSDRLLAARALGL